MASRARAFAEASRDVRAGLSVDEALRDALARHGFEATAQDRARLQTLAQAPGKPSAPRQPARAAAPAATEEAASDVEKQLLRWARMARAGVPLHGIETQMRIQGVKDAHVRAFANWYRAATEDVDAGRALESLINTDFKLDLEPADPVPEAGSSTGAADNDDDEPNLETMLDELGETFDADPARDDAEVVQRLRESRGVDVPANFQLACFVAAFEQERAASAPTASRQAIAPAPLTPNVVRALFLDPFIAAPARGTRQDLCALASLLANAVDDTDAADVQTVLASAVAWLDQVDAHPGGSEAQARAIAAFFAGTSKGPALAPVRCLGKSDVNLVGLLVIPEQDHGATPPGKATFTVHVLNKHHAAYHPQRIDPVDAALRVCPVLTLHGVARLRLLDPTFSSMLAKLHGQASELNSPRVLYEVLLPFLAGSRPLHLAAADTYSGRDVPFWTKAGRARSSLVGLALLGVRLCVFATRPARWRELKLDLRCQVAEAALDEVRADTEGETPLVDSWDMWAAMHVQLARAVLRSHATRDHPRHLVDRLGGRVALAKREHEDAALAAAEMHASPGLHLRSSFVDTVSAVADASASAAIRALAQGAGTTGVLVDHGPRPDARLGLVRRVRDPKAALVDRVDALHELCGAYWQVRRGATVLALVSEAVGAWLPGDPEEWMQCPEWSSSERAQETTVRALLDLARWALSAESPAEGDRVVVVASLYAFANAVVLAPDGADPLSKVLAAMDIWPCSQSMFGADVNEVTASLEISPWLLPVRRKVVAFLCRPSRQQLWDFSHMGTRRAKPELILQLAVKTQMLGQHEGPAGVVAENAQSAARAFATATGLFGGARDLALLFTWACAPLPALAAEVDVVCQAAPGGGKEVITHVYVAGEDIFHDHAVRQRRFRSRADAAQYLPSAQTMAASVSEDVIMRMNVLPTFAGYTSEEEAERILSMLTAPFVRIPGLLALFAAPGRASLLLNADIRAIFCGALLEPLQVAVAPATDDDGAEEPQVAAWADLECPADLPPRLCPSAPPADSLLLQELRQTCTPIVGLVAEIIESLLEACRRVLPAPQELVQALGEIVLTSLVVEAQAAQFHDCSHLGAVLRGACLDFFLAHERFGMCACMYALQDATAWDRSPSEIARWTMTALHETPEASESTRLRHLLASHPEMWCRANIDNATLCAMATEIAGISWQKKPGQDAEPGAGASWALEGVSRCGGDVEIDLLSGTARVRGVVPRNGLPRPLEEDHEVQQLVARYVGSSSKSCVVLVETEANVAVEIALENGDKLFLSLGDAPPLDTRPSEAASDGPSIRRLSRAYGLDVSVVTGVERPEIVSDVGWQELGEEDARTPLRQGVLVQDAEHYGLYARLACGVLLPRDSSNWRASPFSKEHVHACETGLEGRLTACLVTADGKVLSYMPAWTMAAHLPTALWSRRIFWLDEEEQLVWAHDTRGGAGSDGSDRFCVHIESGAVQRGAWELVWTPPRALVRSLGRLEDASQLLFWAQAQSEHAEQVELAERGLQFNFREDTGHFHLDGNEDLYVDPERDHEIVARHCAALRGLSRLVLLRSSSSDEEVAVVGSVATHGFALARLDPARARLQPLERHAALVVVLAKLAGCDYRGATELVALTAADEALEANEAAELDHLSALAGVVHPDAVAARLWILEATLLRRGTTAGVELPKHVALARDAVRYLCVRGHVDPKLRLLPHVARSVLRAAIASGKRRISGWRQCATLRQEEDKSTDVDVQLMSAFLAHYEAAEGQAERVCRPEAIVPLHGGGGWHRLKEGAKRWAEDVLDDPERSKSTKLPSLRPGLEIGSRPGWSEVHRVVNAALEIEWLDPCLVACIGVVRGAGRGDGTGLALVELLAMRLYLHKQSVQGTSIFDWTSFQIACLLTTGTHLPEIPAVPASPNFAQQARYTRILLEALAKSPVVDQWAVARPFCLAQLANDASEGALEIQDEHLAYFGGAHNEIGRNEAAQEPLLASTRIYEQLVCVGTLGPGPGASDPATRERERDAACLHELRSSTLAEPFSGRKRVIDRMEADVVATRQQANSPGGDATYSLDLGPSRDDAQRAVELVDREMDTVRTSIEHLLEAMETACESAFSSLEVAARKRPVLELWDLLRLAARAEHGASALPLDTVETIGRQGCVLQLLGKLRGALMSLNKASDAAAVARERVLELLLTRWEHNADPRWLLFELSAGYTLRRSQVDTLESLGTSAETRSSCVQLKMGQGKSSVVLPLLSMVLANKDVLAVVAVPDALVDMSSRFLARALAPTFGKRVVHVSFARYTLQGETATADALALGDRLMEARRARDVILTTAGSLKALLLKLVELGEDTLQSATEAALGRVWGVLGQAHLVLDECDILLHPLRSELNFPTGPMRGLSQATWRCELARTLVECLHEASDEAAQVAQSTLAKALERGIEEGKLEATPHLVVVDPRYYETFLAGPLAQAAARWICATLDGPDALLRPVQGKAVRATSSSELGPDEHASRHMLDGTSRTFWCSAEFPGLVHVDLVLPQKTRVGAVDVSFEEYSPFAMRSGLSMLPTKVTLETCARGGGSYRVQATSGPFVTKRLYVRDHDPVSATRVRLTLEGDARWFAIRHVEVYEVPLGAPRRRRRWMPQRWGRSASPRAADKEARALALAEALESKSLSAKERGKIATAAGVDSTALVLVELAYTYVHVVLPHCLGKVNGVSHGLVQGNVAGASATRRYMSVPYVGKGVPSPASEFAQPDVLIALTMLAYQYSGLRRNDVRELVELWQRDLWAQAGPLQERKAFLEYETAVAAAQASFEEGTQQAVLPLHLALEHEGENETTNALWARLRCSPFAVRSFCDRVAFPAALRHRGRKLVASGEEMVMAVGRTHGFSGTPSSALPQEMGECQWEEGTEGRFWATLTDERSVSVGEYLEIGWTVKALLRDVARRDSLCALIDTGALVVGLSNREVAEVLLENGLARFKGCVFLDASDRQRVLVRQEEGGAEKYRELGLADAALAEDQRFTFYDHVHTTGMDIAQPALGEAALTMGKDMTFRDYCQGAWRMRRLDRGQRLWIVAPRVVMELVQSELSAALRAAVPVQHQLACWLHLRGLNDLAKQETHLGEARVRTLWRRAALEALCEGRSRSAAVKAFTSSVSFDLTEQAPKNQARAGLSEEAKANEGLLRTRAERKAVQVALQGLNVSGKRLGVLLTRALDGEQQQEQEREKERQVEVSGELEVRQGRAWAGQAASLVPWKAGALLESRWHDDPDAAPFWRLEDMEPGLTVADGVGPIWFSCNHSPPCPEVTARLRNVEVGVFVNGALVVLSLAEANTLRWTQAPVAVVFLESGISTGGGSQGLDEETSMLVARFAGAAHEFDDRQIEVLGDALAPMVASDLFEYYVGAKRHRRGAFTTEHEEILQQIAKYK